MNRWNEIAYSLSDCKEKGILEDDYHIEIENLLRILGWSRFNESLQHKKQLPIGNHKGIEANIVLQKDNHQIAIEVKHPNNKLIKRQIEQLASYMRQIKTEVGIYIGEKICLFYDAPNADKLECCLEVPLEENNVNGQKLCELLSFTNFSYGTLLQFCKEKYKKLADRKILSSTISSWQNESNDAIIKQILTDYFISQGLTPNIVYEEVGKLKLFDKSKGIDKRISLPGESPALKKSKRFRRYRLNKGQPEYKRYIVQSVLSKYLTENQHIQYRTLVDLFKDVKCGRKLFLTVEELRERSATNKDIIGRYNCSESEILISGDKIEFVVCNQWAESNFPTFIKAVKEKIGWSITPV